jgi:hypothetical protein
MDLTESIIPKSDQLNADDLISGPVTVTIAKVSAGSADQPVDVHLVEFPGRAFRPSKSMRRVMVAAWGVEASAYTGRRMTLYRDPTIRFGGMEVGGIRISHLSHIDKSFTLALTVTRGKRAPLTVEPLADSAPAQSEPTAEQVAACSDPDTLRAWWRASGAERRPLIEARVAEMNAGHPAPDAVTEADIPAAPRQNSGISDRTRKGMFAALGKAGLLDDDEQRDEIASILGQPVKSRSEVTEAEALAVIADLQQRVRTAAATTQGTEYDPTSEPGWGGGA